jgi:acyl-coenzyme A synthetase/AMP-(fatty) acid ligase
MGRIDWLLERFGDSAENVFLVRRQTPRSYRWLLHAIQMWRERLAEAKIGGGAVVSIEGDYSPELVALLLALIELGAVIVPLAGGSPIQREEFRDVAEVQYVIAFDTWDAYSITHRGCEVRNPLTCGLVSEVSPGLVLFSSGSTGKSKAALHSFTALLEKFRSRRHSMVTLTMLMLDHIGGLNTLFYILSNTGTVVAVESRDPEVVCEAVEKYGVELLPTSPTFLNLLLLSEAYKRFDLSSLRRITYGTEVMPARTLQRLNEVLPGVELLQTYGLSELGILRSKSRSSDSLWVKVGGEGFETKIQDGTLWIRAQSAMRGYLNAPSPFDSEGWFNTGDAVEVDGEYIRILGRNSERINVGGEKVYPAEVESVLLGMPNVQDVSVIGMENPITGQIVTARFNLFAPEPLPELRRRMREFCRGRLAAFKIPAKIEIVESAQYSDRLKKMRNTGTRAGVQ